MECNALNIKILLLLFAKHHSLNTLAPLRIFLTLLNSNHPKHTRQIFLSKKKSQNQKFQTQKIHSISPSLEFQSTLPSACCWGTVHTEPSSEADLGEGPPLYLDQTKAQRAEKRFFWDRPSSFILGCGWPPPSLSEGLDLPLLMITSCGGSTWPKFGINWVMSLLERSHTGLVGKTNKTKK